MVDVLIATGHGQLVTVVGDQVDTTFGSLGSGVNQFRDPTGLAVTSSGGIVIADRGNDRIVAIDDLSGANWQALGMSGSGNLELKRPSGVAVDTYGRIWIADAGNRRIVRVDAIDGSGWTTYGTSGLPTAADPAIGSFQDPTGVRVTSAGSVLIADPGASRVVRIDDVDGSGWTTSPSGAFLSPTSLAMVGASVVVTDFGGRKVALLDTALAVQRASTDPKLNGPASVVAAGGAYLVLVPPHRTIVTLTDSGSQLSVTGELRLGSIGIERPLALERLP
jgi:hypothetical protein